MRGTPGTGRGNQSRVGRWPCQFTLRDCRQLKCPDLLEAGLTSRCVVRADSCDRFRGHAQPAQAEPHHTSTNFVAVPVSDCPPPPGAGPHHAMNRLRRGRRVDVFEHAKFKASPKLLDERLEDGALAGRNRLGVGEYVVFEGVVESSIDPGGHRLNRCGGRCHFFS